MTYNVFSGTLNASQSVNHSIHMDAYMSIVIEHIETTVFTQCLSTLLQAVLSMKWPL